MREDTSFGITILHLPDVGHDGASAQHTVFEQVIL